MDNKIKNEEIKDDDLVDILDGIFDDEVPKEELTKIVIPESIKEKGKSIWLHYGHKAQVGSNLSYSGNNKQYPNFSDKNLDFLCKELHLEHKGTKLNIETAKIIITDKAISDNLWDDNYGNTLYVLDLDGRVIWDFEHNTTDYLKCLFQKNGELAYSLWIDGYPLQAVYGEKNIKEVFSRIYQADVLGGAKFIQMDITENGFPDRHRTLEFGTSFKDSFTRQVLKPEDMRFSHETEWLTNNYKLYKTKREEEKMSEDKMKGCIKEERLNDVIELEVGNTPKLLQGRDLANENIDKLNDVMRLRTEEDFKDLTYSVSAVITVVGWEVTDERGNTKPFEKEISVQIINPSREGIRPLGTTLYDLLNGFVTDSTKAIKDAEEGNKKEF